MTPAALDAEMKRAIEACKDRAMLGAVGEGLITRALGANAFAYVPAIDAWCRAMRRLNERQEYSPPTTATVGRVIQPEGAL